MVPALQLQLDGAWLLWQTQLQALGCKPRYRNYFGRTSCQPAARRLRLPSTTGGCETRKLQYQRRNLVALQHGPALWIRKKRRRVAGRSDQRFAARKCRCIAVRIIRSSTKTETAISQR